MDNKQTGPSTQRDEQISLAHELERRGQIQEAEAQCRSRLAKNPNDHEAALLFAKIASRTGRGELAKSILSDVLSRDSTNIEALVGLARLSRAQQLVDEAVALCRRALEVAPEYADARFFLGVCLADQWLTEESILQLSLAVSLEPTNPAALDRLAFVLQRAGRDEEAEAAYRRAIELAPSVPNSYINLGNLLESRGDVASAAALYDQVVALTSKSVPGLVSLARAYAGVQNFNQATRVLKRAVALEPGSAELCRLLGSSHMDLGEFSEASKAYQRALKLNPSDARSYIDFAFSRRLTEEDRPFIIALERLSDQKSLTADQRTQCHYALGKAFEDFGEFESAMREYHAANRSSGESKQESLDRSTHSAALDDIIGSYTREFFEKYRGCGSDTDRPVFIVGMLRSGTTLVEQILSSHPEVEAAGELTYLSTHTSPSAISGPDFDCDYLKELADGYLTRLSAVTRRAKRVTDKMPNNFFLAGLIHAAFPNARIIHCRRGKLDNCLSIYITPVSAIHAHSPEGIMFAYDECHRLMAHWRDVLPADRLLEVDYEDLVTAPEPHARRLLEFLGLPWDDAVMRPQDNNRFVNTPSRWQVKQPIYGSSVERWRKFEPWLGEFSKLLK